MIAFRRPSLLAWLLLIGGLLLFVSLGAWQHARAQYKQGLLVQWAQAQQVDAVDWHEGLPQLRRARISGTYLAMPYVLDNQVRDGRGGIEVFVPLQTDSATVLVALGWLPYTGASRELPALPALPDGPTMISGWWLPAPAHGIRMGRGWSQVPGHPKLMPYFALPEIAQDAGLDLPDGVLRLVSDPASPYLRDWQPVEAMPPERHLGYAWQWWSLAAAIVLVFLVVHRKT